MEWSKIAVDFLIEAYSKEKCLYNSKSPAYHNKYARKDALDRIVAALKEVRPTSHGEIITKMKSLRTTFVSELNKIKNSIKSGMGSDQVYKPTVWYFEKLHFLRDHVQPRKGICSTDISPETPEYINNTDGSLITEAQSSPGDGGEDSIIIGEWDVPQDHQPFLESVSSLSRSIPSGSGVTKGTKRKRSSYMLQEENAILDQAGSILNSISKPKPAPTDLEVLGNYVTASLQQLKSKALVMKAKREILNVICNIQEEDMSEND